MIQSHRINFRDQENIYEHLRLPNHGFVGFANYYLQGCWDQSELKNRADVTIYKQLLEIDAKLGTTQSEQLFVCLYLSFRNELLKV